MNIASITLSSLSPSYFKEAFLRPLTAQERNICIVAAIALSLLALGYFCLSCCDSWEISSPTNLVPFITPLPTVVCEDDLIDKIHCSQATSNLYLLAENSLKNLNGLPLRVVIVPPETVFKTGAVCDWTHGMILISSKLDEDQAFTYFLFELANMTQCADFDQIWQSCLGGKLSREEYAYAMESIEYTSTLLHTTTMKDAMEEMGEEWRKHDIFHRYGLDETHYFDQVISAGHVAYYLDNYDRLIQQNQIARI